MYSLENSYSSDELIKWKERLVKVLNTENISYSCELKLDGYQFLSYKNGKLTRGLTEVMVIVAMMLLKISKQLMILWKHSKKLNMILILG